MTNHERVKLAFSDVKAPEGFANKVLNKQGNISTINTQRTGSRRISKVFVIAATVCLVLGLTVTAMATNFFGLRNLELPAPNVGDQFLGIAITEEMLEDPDYAWLFRRDISMQGFEGSPEHAAAVAWRNFVFGYDVDGTLREAVGNTWGDVPFEYLHYNAYTMEMVEKIHEIIETYGLILIGDIIDTRTREEFQTAISYGPLFISESVQYYGNSAALYESGTFRLEGDYDGIHFYMRSSRKGVFDWTYISLGEISERDEWIYENAFGEQLLLIQSETASIIILDTETAFNVILVYSGKEWNDHPWLDEQQPPFTAQDLENFADMIDFAQLRTEAPQPEMIAALEAQRNRIDMDVSAFISALIGGWKLIGVESTDFSVAAWRSMGNESTDFSRLWGGDPDYHMNLIITEDRRFRLWVGENEYCEDSSQYIVVGENQWHGEGEIRSDGSNGYKTVCDVMSNYFPFMGDMQLQYDEETGILRLVLSSEIDGGGMLIFGRTTDSDFTPIPTPEPIPQSVDN